MAELHFEIVRREDAALIDGFRQVIEILDLAGSGQVPRISITPAKGHPAVDLAAHETNQAPLVDLAKKQHTAFWPSAQLNFTFNGNAAHIQIRREDSGRDRVSVTFPEDEEATERRAHGGCGSSSIWPASIRGCARSRARA